MVEQAISARDLVERVRYSGDTLRHRTSGDPSATRRVLEAVYQNELKVTSSVTPGLSQRLDKVCLNLGLVRTEVDAFIYASPEIQAECYASSTKNCILRFSSALVDLLDSDEFEFVVGHEAGHFLLGHGLSRTEGNNSSLEYMMQLRAQEISVDRVGLIACGSLDVAVRAMMKTASGLSGEHLRFDVGAYLRQVDGNSHEGGDVGSTHPSIFVRCRALLWFSLNEAFSRGDRDFSEAELLRIDRHIGRDIEKFIDAPVRQLIDEAQENLLIWTLTQHAIQDGILDKIEQMKISELVGEKNLESLKGFLSDIPMSDVQDEVFQRMKQAREELEQLIPSRFEQTMRSIEEQVVKAFGNKD